MRERGKLGLTLVVSFTLCMFIISAIGAQEILVFKDGSKLIGKVEEEKEGKIIFRTEGDVVMEFSASDVKQIIRPSKDGTKQYLYDDPNYTRLLWSPTGRTLESGKGYFADYYFFFQTIAYGITDRFTIQGAMSIIPFLLDLAEVYFISPKLGIIQRENFAFSAGVMLFKMPAEMEDIPGIAYGVGTWGNKNTSFTAGMGWGGVMGEENELMDGPVIMIGGEHRVSKNIKLLTENWWLMEEGAEDNRIISFGFRFFGERLAVDLGYFHIVGEGMEEFPFIPWVNFVYNF